MSDQQEEEIPLGLKQMLTQWVVMSWFEGHMDALDGPQDSLVPTMEKWLNSGARNTLLAKGVIDELTEAKSITEIFKGTPEHVVTEAFEYVAKRALSRLGIDANVILHTPKGET